MNQHYFTGYIASRQPKKVYTKTSPFYRQINYQLTIKSGSESQQLFVYANLVPANVFRTVREGNYGEKKYLFTCQKGKWGWILLDWKEIQLAIA